MSIFKGRGIILKENNVGESDKVLTLLLKEKGRITISARGARKPKSNFMSASQQFTYADFVIFQGQSFYSLNHIDQIEGFYSLRNSLDRLMYAQLFAELCDKTIMEEMPSDEILYLLLKAFQQLSKTTTEPVKICGAFLLKYLQLNGYEPTPAMVKASAPAQLAIRYILDAPLKNVFLFRLDQEHAEELNQTALFLLRNHVEVKLKSLEIIETNLI